MKLEPTCLTHAEAARRLGVPSTAEVRRLARMGALVLVKVRGRWLVPVSELRWAAGAA